MSLGPRDNGTYEILYSVLVWLTDDIRSNHRAQLHELYDVATDTVRFVLDPCGMDYDEWWAPAINDYLGPLRCSQELLWVPNVELEAYCFTTERNNYRDGGYSDYYEPRDFEWMLYAVDGFEREEIELHIMAPYMAPWADDDDFEWMFYVDFALSLCRDVVFEYRDNEQEWCLYNHVVPRYSYACRMDASDVLNTQ